MNATRLPHALAGIMDIGRAAVALAAQASCLWSSQASCLPGRRDANLPHRLEAWAAPKFRLPPTILLFIAGLMINAALAVERPNFVLILADDLGVNDLSCYGRKDQRTPHLDRLAAGGTRFDAAYCAQPICSPSRAALLTGKSPARLHLTNFLPGRADAPSQKLLQPVIEGRLPLEEVTLAELLRDAGYATGCIGKWHLGGKGFGPAEQGFGTVFPGRANTTPGETEGSKGEYELAAAAEKFLEENRARPFFLYLAHNSPHIPFSATPDEIRKNADAFNPAYAAVIEHLDASVGRVLAKLAALALTERTLLVFTSDNGGLHVLESPGTPATHNTPFRAGKGYLYEGGLRVPLIIRWPDGAHAGTVDNRPVMISDLMPTVLKLAGLDPAKTVGPLDSVSLAEDPATRDDASRPLFWHFPHYTNQGGRPGAAIREANWKLIEHFEDARIDLFDLATDPGETRSLAEREGARAAAMRAKLAAWRRSVGAQECTPNPAFDPAQHRALYVERDSSKVPLTGPAAQIATEWKPWRTAMNAAVKGREPRVTPAAGDIRLHARDATIHGEKLRYEPEPHKNTLGYWVRAEDWAEWKIDLPKSGAYEVEILQGCKGGGSEVAVEVAGRNIVFTVEDTGHFQSFISRTIGAVDLKAGPQTLALKPRTKSGAAIMDCRRVVLRPIP